MAGPWQNRFLKNWCDNYHREVQAQSAIEPFIAAKGLMYRSQHPFAGYHIIADFFFPTLGLRIEIDGKEHRQKKKREKDEQGDKHLLGQNIITVRLTNEEVMEDPEAALEKAFRIYNERIVEANEPDPF